MASLLWLPASLKWFVTSLFWLAASLSKCYLPSLTVFHLDLLFPVISIGDINVIALRMSPLLKLSDPLHSLSFTPGFAIILEAIALAWLLLF